MRINEHLDHGHTKTEKLTNTLDDLLNPCDQLEQSMKTISVALAETRKQIKREMGGWVQAESSFKSSEEKFRLAMRGMSILNYHYDDPNKVDSLMIYVPSLRRIRKMSATDTQDTQGDLSYDDSDTMSQKITPKKYPYKIEIIAEREYLMPFSYGTSPAWVDSKNNYELKEIQFQRRPCP
jgi:hypothetical protein